MMTACRWRPDDNGLSMTTCLKTMDLRQWTVDDGLTMTTWWQQHDDNGLTMTTWQQIPDNDGLMTTTWQQQPDNDDLATKAWWQWPDDNNLMMMAWLWQSDDKDLTTNAWWQQPDYNGLIMTIWQQRPEDDGLMSTAWQWQPDNKGLTTTARQQRWLIHSLKIILTGSCTYEHPHYTALVLGRWWGHSANGVTPWPENDPWPSLAHSWCYVWSRRPASNADCF